MSHSGHGHDTHDSHGHDDHHAHGHDDHGHDSHDDHGHDSHGHDAHDHGGHDSHDSHGHDNNDAHGHDDHGHDSHDDHDEHGHDEHSEHEEEHEKEFKKLNDLIGVKIKDVKDVDIYEIFKLSPLQPFQHLFKKNTVDIGKQELHKINLTLHPKIKILHLKRPIHDIIKIKKVTDININTYSPPIDKHTLNMMDLENTFRFSGPFSDIIKPKESLVKTFSNFTKNISLPKFQRPNFSFKNFRFPQKSLHFSVSPLTMNPLKMNPLKAGMYFLFIVITFTAYGLFTKYQLESTLGGIKNLQFSSNIEKMKSDLVNVKSDVIISNFLLKPIFGINYFVGNHNISNVKYALSGVGYLMNYAINLITFYDGVHNLIEQKGPGDVMYTELLKNTDSLFLEATQNINASLENLSKIQNFSDQNIQNIFHEKLALIEKIQHYTEIFYENKELILKLLGDDQKRTYLVVFQNSDEIRPTGGFMGSVALVQLYKGKIMNFEKKDIYALEWLIKDTFHEAPPEGLASITDVFALRDANYDVHIKESSEKIKSFIDQTQYHIDGVVYINQNIILDFLKKFGGVYFDMVKREVTSENFSLIVSTLVEAKVTQTHTLATPKQVLFDFIDLYASQLKKDGKYAAYFQTLLESVEKRDIIFYSFTPEENEFLKKIFLVHDIDFSKNFDFNYPVFTSISGNKSDRYIERTFTKKVTQNQDCSIVTQLKLEQKHTFTIAEEINIKNFLYDMDLLGKVDLESTLVTQGKALNKQYIRILLPKSAQVKENKKIKVQKNADAQEVSFYLNTNLLFPTEMNIEYTLPNPECKKYEYVFFKQPGIKEYKLNLTQDGNLVTDSYFNKDYKLK